MRRGWRRVKSCGSKGEVIPGKSVSQTQVEEKGKRVEPRSIAVEQFYMNLLVSVTHLYMTHSRRELCSRDHR